MKFKACGKVIIIEPEKPKELANPFGLVLESKESDETTKVIAVIKSIGAKVTKDEPEVIFEGSKIMVFKNKINWISGDLAITDEDQIICGV